MPKVSNLKILTNQHQFDSTRMNFIAVFKISLKKSVDSSSAHFAFLAKDTSG